MKTLGQLARELAAIRGVTPGSALGYATEEHARLVAVELARLRVEELQLRLDLARLARPEREARK